MPNTIGAFLKLYAFNLGAALLIKQTENDFAGVVGKQREVSAFAIKVGTARVGLAFFYDAHGCVADMKVSAM